MTTLIARPNGCVQPVPIDNVVGDPDAVVDLAKRSGPYFMPARYLIDGVSTKDARKAPERGREDVPSYLIGPVWRGDWAYDGAALVPGSEGLLDHPGFIAAAQQMYAADVVVPQQVYVNLSGPMGGNPFSHVDIAEFVGLDRSNAPGRFLQAMGSSRLFEDERITIATAVAWFHSGPRGFFRYWPDGRESESVRHESMWNSAVVGDNDFMHHKVERVGTDDAARPGGLAIDTELDHDGRTWVVLDRGRCLASYDDDDIRISVSWKAKVYKDEATQARAESGEGAITLPEALERLARALGEPLEATGEDALASPALRDQLSSRWSGYVAG